MHFEDRASLVLKEKAELPFVTAPTQQGLISASSLAFVEVHCGSAMSAAAASELEEGNCSPQTVPP